MSIETHPDAKDTKENRMGKLVISENVTLDGVMQDPTGDESFGRGGWANRISEQDRQAWGQFLLEEALSAEAQLLGRRTYESFAGRFPSRSGAWADRLNGMPKYVVSSSLTEPEWNNTTVLRGDVVDEVSKLKRELGGEIVVYASGRLVPTLMEHDLVDELRLIVYPVVLGSGQRLFADTVAEQPARLTGVETIGNGLVSLVYGLVHDA